MCLEVLYAANGDLTNPTTLMAGATIDSGADGLSGQRLYEVKRAFILSPSLGTTETEFKVTSLIAVPGQWVLMEGEIEISASEPTTTINASYTRVALWHRYA